jgi:hypothetical protein
MSHDNTVFGRRQTQTEHFAEYDAALARNEALQRYEAERAIYRERFEQWRREAFKRYREGEERKGTWRERTWRDVGRSHGHPK